MEALDHITWLGNPALAWLIATGAAVLAWALVHGVLKVLTLRARAASRRHPQSTALQVLAATGGATRAWSLLALMLSLALRFLELSPEAAWVLRWLSAAFFGIQLALWASAALLAWMRRATPEGTLQKSNPVIHGILTWTVELIVWVTLALVLMAQAGVQIGAFVASLGIGGIAIAMAAKNVLEDLFASLAIGLDKPFREGDYIAFGDNSGTIRKVGIKSTRIRSLSGEQIVIGNTALLQKVIHNYERMRERRIVFGFRVPLTTTGAQLETLVARTREIIRATPKTRFDRGHFLDIQPEGFRCEFVYYVVEPGYGVYCDAQQQINLAVIALLGEMGLSFAMPARRMYAAGEAAGSG